MKKQGDLNVNLVQRHSDSHREYMKHTILNQELIFRNQILELHRLYKMQKMLMQELSWKEPGKCNIWKASTQSNLTQLTIFHEIPKAIEECTSSCNKLQQRHLDLEERMINCQLPAIEYSNSRDAHRFEKQILRDYLKESEDGPQSCGDDFANLNNLKLSLGNGECSEEMGGTLTISDAKRNYSCSPGITNRQCPVRRMFNENDRLTPLPHENYFNLSLLSGQSISKSAKCDPSDGITYSKSQPRFNFLDEAQEEYIAKIPDDNLQPRKPPVVDLNTVIVDSSPCYSNDATAVTSHSTSLAGKVRPDGPDGCCIFGYVMKDGISSSDEKHNMLQGERRLNNAMLNSEGKTISGLTGKNHRDDAITVAEISSVDLEASSRRLPGCFERVGTNNGTIRNEDVELTSESSNSLVLEQQEDNARAKDSDDDEKDALLSSSEKSCQDASQDGYRQMQCGIRSMDSDSSSIKTAQSGHGVGKSSSFMSEEKSIARQAVETSSNKEETAQRISIGPENNCPGRQDSPEGDELIQEAANSLIRISLTDPAWFEDCSRQVGSNEVEKDIDNPTKAPSSSDSYELNVLMLEENSTEDYSVTSKAFDIAEASDKDFSVRLRRGRRLKDFQKEILPGLASLSRHEILEDVNILEGVIRSREYRKLRANMADGEMVCTPLRSRRSRSYHAGRRRYC
ncbi:uncharacterized protein LOC115746434 [Rhodamnia argentea]|uniref:Uncharacterized protein LOC115746434 isoform X1 n=1 Tax=Rhodamnia argentea TaxID=178133 RepID=A0A8B8PTF4_9MYRT|nr:uncharacterized protein LOC115746434 [Rhodamnia argentea]XP_030538052.1 uncharacterized protein LOC115746434 [Rhodamnia argentea]